MFNYKIGPAQYLHNIKQLGDMLYKMKKTYNTVSLVIWKTDENMIKMPYFLIYLGMELVFYLSSA